MACTLKGERGCMTVFEVGGQALGCAKTSTVTRNSAVINTTTYSSLGDEEVRPGNRSITVSAEGLFVPDNAAIMALEAAQDAGTLVQVEITTESGYGETFCAMVETFERVQPQEDVVTFSISLRSSGPITRITPAS